MRRTPAHSIPRIVQRGFTLVELMIAVLIGLFLVGALLTLVQAMKRTSGTQSGLSQLQDNQRMAMTLMINVIQSAGYYTNPYASQGIPGNVPSGAFPAQSPFAVPGQVLTGGAVDAALGDSITVRYMTAGGDGVVDCSGKSSPVSATFVNTFVVDNLGNLNCILTVNGGAQQTLHLIGGQTNAAGQLVSGVTQLQVYYGVQTNLASGTRSVDTYMDAAGVIAANAWSNVISVAIKLTFVNPLSGQPGQTATIPFAQVVDVMTNVGVTP